MKSWLLWLADHLRQSYWFLPSVMVFVGMLLAGGMIWIDSHYGSGWMDRFAWLYASRPSGARQVLSVIGGSMITVAGVVFSVTVAAVVYASGQHGPRLLSNFMRDRGNQLTLGTFITTFAYCLIVLRTIRSPEETGGIGFVPNLALLIAVLLAICSIAVLIFFIHHVPSKIHINSVIDDIGKRLIREVENRFPDFIGAGGAVPPGREDQALPAAFREDAGAGEVERLARISAHATGYIQLIDEDTVLRVARENDLICRMQYQPGDFIHAGRALVEIWPPDRCEDATARRIRDAFAIGTQRTPLQDLRFLIDELVEIAARALSPGINDPFTAMTCLDWLGAAMSTLCQRELPSHLRKDEAGDIRVIAHPLSFRSFLERSFGALVQYCASDMIAALRYLEALGELAIGCKQHDRLATVASYADKLGSVAETGLDGYNRRRVSERIRQFRQAVSDPDYERRLRQGNAWLDGAA